MNKEWTKNKVLKLISEIDSYRAVLKKQLELLKVNDSFVWELMGHINELIETVYVVFEDQNE
ncbi:hypothetical protein [[Mycoplasma] testudinis]|uniref:hypothetical protein n=1 Tax=[Mycoplasma] testudinis TaxID=33924 RepID=UPI000483E319|nr:hypothetical protein [[Mycoplasma] testudinis]